MRKIQEIISNYDIIRNKINLTSLQFTGFKKKPMDYTFTDLFTLIEDQNSLILELGNYMNILIRYIIGEERTINNTCDPILNIGVNLPHKLSTRDFITNLNDKNNNNIIDKFQKSVKKKLSENNLTTNTSLKENSNPNMNKYLLRSSSSINIIKTKNKSINSLNKHFNRNDLKPFKQTKNMLRNQYRILEEYSSKKDKYSTKSMSNASYN